MNTTASSLMLDHAVALARLGIEVILVHNAIITSSGVMCDCHKGYSCPSIGKHPIDNDWAGSATTDEATVRRRWQVYPGASIGIPTGRRFRRVALDADGAVGVATLRQLEQKLGPLPTTVTALTPSGGEHRIFVNDDVEIPNSVQKLGEKLDVRGEGGQIVAAPSLHRSGRRYGWVHPPNNTAFARLPPAWLEALVGAGRHEDAARPGGTPASAMHAGDRRRTTTTQREARALLTKMLGHPLIHWMVENPDDVSREVWRGVAVNFATAVDGHAAETELAREAFNTISEDYAGYTRRECDDVFRRAFESARNVGPMRFDTMIDAGAPAGVCTGGTTLIHASRRMIGR
jgi:hypothetical protein